MGGEKKTRRDGEEERKKETNAMKKQKVEDGIREKER